MFRLLTGNNVENKLRNISEDGDLNVQGITLKQWQNANFIKLHRLL